MGRSAPTAASRRDYPGGQAVDGPRGLEAVMEAVAARHRVRLPVRRTARRRCRAANVPVVHHRKAALQAQGGVRQGRHRRRRRTRGRQQCFGRRHFGADALARFAHQRHRGGDAHRVRVLRNPAWPNAVREGAAADLDADRQPVHRQFPAAGAQPPAGAAVGQAAAHAAALPVRGHPVLRGAWRARGERAAAGPCAAAGVRPAWPDDATVRVAGAAADHRGHPRASRSNVNYGNPCSWAAANGPACSPNPSRSSPMC